MKKTVLTLLAIALLALTSNAQSVGRKSTVPSATLGWNAPVVPSGGAAIASYNLYHATASGVTTGLYSDVTSVPVPSLTFTKTPLAPGVVHYFAVTSVDVNGLESLYSNEVSWQANTLPNSPTLKITASVGGVELTAVDASPGVWYALDYSRDLVGWSELARQIAGAGGELAFSDATLEPVRFYSARWIP